MIDPADNLATLVGALESSDKPSLRKAVDSLIRLAVDDPAIGIELAQRLTDPRRKNRWAVAYVLASLPSADQRSIPILIETLGDRDPDIRWAVALLLVRLAKKDQAIARRLFETIAQGTAIQRRMAIYCVRDLSLLGDTTSKALVDALADADPMVRVAAVTSLAQTRDLDADSRAVILQLFLKDVDNRVRNASAITLAKLGSPTEELLTALQTASQGNDLGVQKAANAALELLKIKRSAPGGN
jgi:HEAT repeat protein